MRTERAPPRAEPAAEVWQAPDSVQKKKPAPKAVQKAVAKRPEKIHPRDLEQAVLEELSEQEILVVLEAISVKSPEAQRMLDEVRRRMDELRRLDLLRQL